MPKKPIKLAAPKLSGPGVTITGTDITIDLSDEAVLGAIAPSIKEGFEDAIRNTRAQPKPSTIDRRGPGRFFNVTGRFLNSLESRLKDGDGYQLIGYLSKSVRGWLFRRIPSARPQRILTKYAKKWAREFGKKVFTKGGKLSQDGKVVK